MVNGGFWTVVKSSHGHSQHVPFCLELRKLLFIRCSLLRCRAKLGCLCLLLCRERFAHVHGTGKLLHLQCLDSLLCSAISLMEFQPEVHLHLEHFPLE